MNIQEQKTRPRPLREVEGEKGEKSRVHLLLAGIEDMPGPAQGEAHSHFTDGRIEL